MASATKDEQLPVEVIFFSGPTSIPISSDSQQVEQSHEAEHQPDEE